LLVGVVFTPRLVSLAYHNRGEMAWVREELATPGMGDAAVIRAYERAVAADPGNFLPYLGYGRWALSQGDPIQAASWLERAVTLTPAHRPARFYLGLSYLEQDRLEQATLQFRHSDARPSYLVGRGWYHVMQTREQEPEARDWTAAERYYRAAVALSPADLTLWGYLADFYIFWPQAYGPALATWRAAARALPASPVPHRRAADLLWSHWHDAPAALAELEEAVRLAPGDVETYLQAAAILRDPGDLAAAAILRDPGDLAAAEAWLRRATAAAPGNGEAYFRLGELYLAQGRAPQAIQALRAATAAAPDVARYHARLGQALRSMGLLTEAIRAVEAAAALEPAEPAHQRLLDELYREAGKPEPTTGNGR
jgi:tetratricopeptide (TPR) repeat protein